MQLFLVSIHFINAIPNLNSLLTSLFPRAILDIVYLIYLI